MANGSSNLDLSVLSVAGQGARQASPDWDYNALDKSFDDDSDLRASSPTGDGQDDPMLSASRMTNTSSPSSQPPVPNPSQVTPSSSSGSSKPVLKRKNPFDHVKEITAQSYAAKIECAKLKKLRADREAETQLEIERLRINAQREQDERRRQHELLVLDRQLELARLQSGLPTRILQPLPSLPNTNTQAEGI